MASVARLSIVIEYPSGADMPAFGPNTHALGGRVVAFAVGDRLVDPVSASAPPAHNLESLSMREQQVLAGIAAGHTVSRIATDLGINRRTVNSYRYRIHDTLGVGNDVQAVVAYLGATKK